VRAVQLAREARAVYLEAKRPEDVVLVDAWLAKHATER
jgi:hypothetical protein